MFGNPSKCCHWRCSGGILRGFAKFCTVIKKETLVQVFSREFSEISKDTFFTEHAWATASISINKSKLLFNCTRMQHFIY